MENIKAVFFDLDDTLWDHARNSELALRLVYRGEPEVRERVDETAFWLAYNRCNEHLWAEYRAGRVVKEAIRALRFTQTLSGFGVTDADLAARMSEAYIDLYPRQPLLVEHAREVLEYLAGKYPLGILTNGFQAAQRSKLTAGGIAGFFRYFVDSEAVGYPKPHPAMYAEAVRAGGRAKAETLVVGDDFLIDIAGARQYGLPTVYFNPRRQLYPADQAPTAEIASLRELKNLL